MEKSRIILNYLYEKKQASLDDIIKDTDVDTYYCNGRFHVGNIVNRLIKSGRLARVKKGVYKFVRFDKLNKNNTSNIPKLF